MLRALAVLAGVTIAAQAAVQAAPTPIRIGITTILSGPMADRGQSEQYGAQLALDSINQAGGVLGRPVEAYYADNACNPEIGVPAAKRLIEEEHVPVLKYVALGVGAAARIGDRHSGAPTLDARVLAFVGNADGCLGGMAR